MKLRVSLAAWLTIPLCAHAATYVIQPVKIPHVKDPLVTGIGADGTLGGTFVDHKGIGQGFLLNGTNVTLLPNLLNNGSRFGAPGPTSILADGTVAGLAYIGDAEEGFVWRNGKYKAIFAAGGVGGTPLVAINPAGTVIVDAYIGSGQYNAAAGKPPNFTALTPPGSFPYAVSINREGTISGTFFPSTETIFLYKGGEYSTVFYPGASATYGGFLNNANLVAGTYQDSQFNFHGFVEQGGKYTSFDPPGKATMIYVNGLSDTGYVAGLYSNVSNQHGFVYRSGTLNVFAHWKVGDAVLVVGVSDTGTVAFVKNGKSYIATCTGSGC